LIVKSIYSKKQRMKSWFFTTAYG